MNDAEEGAAEALAAAVGRMRTHSKEGEQNPHKLLLLLSIAALLQVDPDHPNEFTFAELEPIFLTKFECCIPTWPANRRHLEYPFYHLQTDGFWHLKLKAGQETTYQQYQRTRLTKARLTETVQFAYLDQSAFQGLRQPQAELIVEGQLKKMMSTEEPTDQGIPSRFEHERWAIDIIRRDVLKGSLGYILSNVQLFDRESNLYFEYDVIVVARSGIYVVELKHWTGHIIVARDFWTRDGDRHPPDPHKNNRYKCQVLKGLYERQYPSYPNVWVTSIVVLTNPEATVENADFPGVAAEIRRDYLTFKSVDDLISYLRQRDQGPHGALLTDAQVTGVFSLLNARLQPARSNLYTIPGYETVEYLSQRPECIELIARRTDGRSSGLYRFRVFRMPVGGSPEERQRARRKAFNTVDAVNRIGEHPNVHRVNVWQNDDGDILELSDWSEAGTLKQVLADRRAQLPVDQKMAICRGIALALAEAHRLGIYHRAVKPEHVLMMNGIPKLIDFDLSYDLDRPTGEVTVIPDPAALKDDGYTPPELLAGKGLNESTDLFGLGVVAYELTVGQKPFGSVRRLAALGGRLSEEQVCLLRERGLPELAVKAIADVIVADADARLGDAGAVASAFQVSSRPEPIPNASLEPGSRYDVYEIVEQIGRGADGQVYRASAEEQEQVVIKLFDREVPRDRIFGQVHNAASVVSRHVVRHAGRPGHWQSDRFFAVMEYVDGETLRKRIEQGERPDSGSLQRVGEGLLDALTAMHGRCDASGQATPLIHGDVKPDNVLLTSGGEPKLTDFSIAGPPRTDLFQGTPGYVAPDRIQESEMEFTKDGDLFALGVTLWEFAFGSRPYENPSVAARPELPGGAGVRFSPALCGWLAKSVATRAGERFSSAADMLAALREALSPSAEPEPELLPVAAEILPEAPNRAGLQDATLAEVLASVPVLAEVSAPWLAVVSVHDNAFVAYLNTLANTSPANAGATAEGQQNSIFFARIRVDNPISELVRRWLVEESRNVILTGNAGDGKTTIAAEVFQDITGQPLPNRSRVAVPGHDIVIIKDMSELTDGDRARYLEEAFVAGGPRYLIVSNTGTLLKGVSRARLAGVDPNETESELLSALEADDARDILIQRFRLLNLGRTDSIDTACHVFRRMLEVENWTCCEGCDLAATCPIFENLRLVRENEATFVYRVELLYRRLYEYGVRLTMRQMTGHLAYALTSGRDCAQVRGMSAIALAERGAGYVFFNRFFGDDGRQPALEAGQMEPVKQVGLADFGLALDPWFERDVWGGEVAGMPLAGRALALGRRLRGEGDVPAANARRQLRRLVYFCGRFDPAEEPAERRYLSVFLRSPMLLDYLRVARGDGKVPPAWEADWRRRVIQVLQEYFAGVRLAEGGWRDTDALYVTLNRRSAGSGTQLVLASFATTDFHLVARKRHAHMEVGGWHLCLEKRGASSEMPLDLPFLDYVAGRCEGEVAAQISAFYADRLERFQAQLIAASAEPVAGDSSLKLLRLSPDRKLSPITLRFSNGRLEVL